MNCRYMNLFVMAESGILPAWQKSNQINKKSYRGEYSIAKARF
jgi:hypothetical protein